MVVVGMLLWAWLAASGRKPPLIFARCFVMVKKNRLFPAVMDACMCALVSPRFVVALPWLLLPLLAQAEIVDGQGIALRAEQQWQYDNNLYRLPDEFSAGADGRDDWLTITRAIARIDYRPSRQWLFADAEYGWYRYREHGDLDYKAPRFNSGWNWELGRRWQGELGYSYRESAADFEGIGSTSRGHNSFNRSRAGIDFRLDPDWWLGAGAEQIRNRYSYDTRPDSGYDALTYEGRISYRPASGNRIGLSLRHTDGERPHVASGQGSIREYRQRDYRLAGQWQWTGDSRIDGYLGYSERSYPTASQFDFDGITGKLQWRWQATGKLALASHIRREIGAEEDENEQLANYAVTEALGLNLGYALSAKWQAGLMGELKWRKLRLADEVLAEGNSQRGQEFLPQVGLNVGYQPYRWLSVGMAQQWLWRDSRIELRDYDAALTSATVAVRF